MSKEAPVKLSACLSRLEKEGSGESLHIEHCAALGSYILYCVPVLHANELTFNEKEMLECLRTAVR